ncbi:hypothetical protein TvY486_0004390 [Trypanosoma vivax Y486]|uniref:Uncharacterized protein n=1 Tax=Trypanosoma vivax (strain Y486) TaxID=1055687 RepID=F9WVU7_TRYVY|nr:hypothetical protein TvY486_0004390 [Trypanosoma vivax Y486]|eukprot:CCD21708.1 hypothetical protein TvY486_0004390 [Trypanosoma vivax Y486]
MNDVVASTSTHFSIVTTPETVSYSETVSPVPLSSVEQFISSELSRDFSGFQRSNAQHRGCDRRSNRGGRGGVETRATRDGATRQDGFLRHKMMKEERARNVFGVACDSPRPRQWKERHMCYDHPLRCGKLPERGVSDAEGTMCALCTETEKWRMSLSKAPARRAHAPLSSAAECLASGSALGCPAVSHNRTGPVEGRDRRLWDYISAIEELRWHMNINYDEFVQDPGCYFRRHVALKGAAHRSGAGVGGVRERVPVEKLRCRSAPSCKEGRTGRDAFLASATHAVQQVEFNLRRLESKWTRLKSSNFLLPASATHQTLKEAMASRGLINTAEAPYADGSAYQPAAQSKTASIQPRFEVSRALNAVTGASSQLRDLVGDLIHIAGDRVSTCLTREHLLLLVRQRKALRGLTPL